MNLLYFARIVGKLKRIPRTGWVNHQINDPESVAEHSFRVALLAMALAKSFKVDELKVIKMGLIHDLAEAEIGDIVTKIGEKTLPNLESKLRAERKAMEHIAQMVEEEELVNLFDEYEQGSSIEAKLVRQLDKLEMAIQAHEYEIEQVAHLEEFFETSRQEVVDPDLKNILVELENFRRKID